MVIYVARHGETSWNREGRWQGHTDVTLNQPGRDQARALANALAGLGIARVRSSNLSRARETAEIVAQHLGLGAVELDPGLRERRFGCFEGLTRQECEARFPEEWTRYRADPRRIPPGGEPHQQVVERMRAAALGAAAVLGPEGAALLLSHGGAMRALVASITGLVPPPLENGATFRLEVVDGAFGPVSRLR